MPDKGASVLAKLRNKAKLSGISYQHCLQLFFQEEFLRRLSKSQYIDNLILKGGLYIYTLTGFESRATVDIDMLLSCMSSEISNVDKTISEILDTSTGNNDVVKMVARKSVQISSHSDYPGVTTQIIGSINNVRVPFDLDIGVGDVIVPKPQKRKLQTQLEDYEKPEILTYTLESTIAEKMDAILQRLELTSRMKDFYDIFYLSRSFDFDGLILQQAIGQTLHNRGTTYDKESINRFISLAEDTDMQVKWRYFIRNIHGSGLTFTEVIHGIDTFLHTVFDSMVKKEEFDGNWIASESKWISRKKPT